jgi:hypothetical protein
MDLTEAPVAAKAVSSRVGSRRRQAGIFRITQHEIHRLNRLAGCTLYQVIQRGDGDDPSGASVLMDREITVV